MPTVNFTAAFIRSVTCGSSLRKVDYFDREQRGFLLEVRASGGKTFHQRYSGPRGRLRQCKLGSAEVLAVDQARKEGQGDCRCCVARS